MQTQLELQDTAYHLQAARPRDVMFRFLVDVEHDRTGRQMSTDQGTRSPLETGEDIL
jgi:hypothetical protein